MTILIDGSPVVTSHPAQIVAGRIMAPLVPVVTQIADAISLRDGRTLVIERGRRQVALRISAAPPCPVCDVYVPLAPLVRTLGGTLRYDARAGCVALSFGPRALRTPEPYDMLALPHPAATTLAWPSPPKPAAKDVAAGVPQPRRTPVEVRIPGL